MKINLLASRLNGVLVLAFATLLFSCSQLEPFSLESDDVLKSSSPTGPSVPAVFYNTGPGGNVECGETGDYLYSSGRVDSDFSSSFPEGFTVTVTDGKYVTWSYSDPNGLKCLDGISVIVKGGNAANVYTYESGVSGDSFLVSPTNRGSQTPDLSNLTFCYNLKDCEDEPCFEWDGQTAWASEAPRANRYNRTGGNWATWIYKDHLPTVDIFAGQTIPVGEATFTPYSDTHYQVNIALTNARLANTSENVKIQHYSHKPTGNPNPGGFASKYDGRTEIILVPKADYYGFHLDVEVKGREIACVEE